jgi:hypothetical protein
MVTGQSIKIIIKDSINCVATSCVSEWKSAEGQIPDEILKEVEIKVCTMISSASAGKATGTGMLALAATSAAAALFIF